MKEKLKLLSTVKYECYGYPMTGIFYSGDTSVLPKMCQKYFYYFRNAADDRLKEICDHYFDDPEDCLDFIIVKLTELQYLK